jgi:peptide chain release factor 1
LLSSCSSKENELNSSEEASVVSENEAETSAISEQESNDNSISTADDENKDSLGEKINKYFSENLFSNEYSTFKTSLMNANETELGGFREVTFMIEGDGAYSRFKFESGVHRVQRVPETESQGRIQTSTATVAVLPEAEDVEVEINPADIIVESCKSSGAGGQHINKTESAVRITHKPTGIIIECQEERSQFKNRDKALKMLKTKLYDIKLTEQNEKIASDRKSQVGTGDRSERIRTYNYPQGRITDHRIGLTLYSLQAFLDGNIGAMIDALITADTAEKLKNSAT